MGLLAAIFSNRLAGQDEPNPQPRDKQSEFSAQMEEELEPRTFFNLELGTWGGKQFWTDFVHLQGYRIQQNSETGHFRLLDPGNQRLTWGNFAGCRQVLAGVAADKSLPPMRGRVVIVLHGLSRSRSSMESLSSFLREEHGMTVINMTYASGRKGIEDHARALRSIIDHLPEVDEINFVGHSLGNIVVRYCIGKYGSDPRFRRMVMLGPPNHGSAMARLLEKNLLFRSVTGLSGQQLATQFDELRGTLAVPGFEFAIIAGATGSGKGLTNPLLDGENDLTVAVEETRLAGAADFMTGNFWHSTMMNDPAVQEATATFLQNGYLISPDERKPVAADEIEPKR